MEITKDHVALVTGASGGLGAHICHALAKFGVRMALVAFPGVELERLASELQRKGATAQAWAADLRISHERERMFADVIDFFGRVDLLVNNAGVEYTAAYHELPGRTIDDILQVNLVAPMVLTRLALPDMLQRRTGHILNMASLAGKSGPAFQEPYAATKAGLVGFTQSLRATYFGTGVSASVICPGFVEAGIYARLRDETGYSAPALLGPSRVEAVAKAVVRAIGKDLPEVIINPYPVRPLFALTALFPQMGERAVRALGVHRFFGKIAQAHAAVKKSREIA